MSTPLVSVAIPCYQAHAHVHHALESLAKQDYSNLEILLVSDDGTDYSAHTQPFKSILDIRLLSTGAVATGYVNAKQIAYQASSGSFFSQLDADDALDPQYFSRLIPLVLSEGACVTPRRTIDFVTRQRLHTQGEKHFYAQYAKESCWNLAHFLSIPFNWQTLYSKKLITMPWPDCFEDDLYFDAHVFEKIGYVPFEPYFGYDYCIRDGSICHSEGIAERVIDSYKTAITRLQKANDRMNLSTETCALLAHELQRRIQNITRYLQDQQNNMLLYEPRVLIDVIHYPQKNTQ